MSENQYLILEYQTCQQKISIAVEHLVRIDLYVFIGISALYAWLYSAINANSFSEESVDIVLYLPTLLAVIAWCRSSMQRRYISSIAKYLRLIEIKLSNYNINDSFWPYVGWETWYEKCPKTWTKFYRFLLWPGLTVGTMMIAISGIGIHEADESQNQFGCRYQMVSTSFPLDDFVFNSVNPATVIKGFVPAVPAVQKGQLNFKLALLKNPA